MPRFAANLSLMYPELPFLDRFAAAAADGFRAVEYLFPYEWPAQELRRRLQDHGLQQVLFNAPPAGTDPGRVCAAWAAGERGTASLPGRESEFRYGVELAITYATAIDCPRIHVMSGCIPQGADPERHRATLVSNLAWAATQAAAHGLRILIEPLNPRDMPRYFLQRQSQAHALVQEVGAANLQVQLDLYHCQIVEGDLATQLRQALPTGRVGHIQIAGVPERHEPDIGEIHYPYLFQLIDELSQTHGWDGWIGCEYRPRQGGQTGGTSAGLGWIRPWLPARPNATPTLATPDGPHLHG